MPIIFLVLVLLIFYICFILIFNIKKEKKIYLDKGSLPYMIIYLFSLICIVIDVGLFINLGNYVDEYGTSSDIVLGGDFWNYMNWLKLLLIFVICNSVGIKLFKK